TTPGTTPIIFSTSNFPKMTPCPCSPHFKTTPLRTVASIARWKEMMSQEDLLVLPSHHTNHHLCRCLK
ncbi:hypothetical protein LINGRAHAP2_LOCUS30124, partial [Linum grandiflorum]